MGCDEGNFWRDEAISFRSLRFRLEAAGYHRLDAFAVRAASSPLESLLLALHLAGRHAFVACCAHTRGRVARLSPESNAEMTSAEGSVYPSADGCGTTVGDGSYLSYRCAVVGLDSDFGD